MANERVRRALESPDPIQRVEALDKLSEGGSSGRSLVASMLRDPSARVRKKAVAALGGLGVGPHLGQVIDRLNDADLEVRLTAVRVLGDSGSKAARPALLLTLQDPSMVVRRAAGLALEALGLSRADQVRDLAEEHLVTELGRLDHRDDQIRANAAVQVGLSGRPSGLPRLFKLLADPSPLVVQAAARAIGRIGGSAALARLVALSRGKAATDRKAATLGLAELRSGVGRLGELLADPDPGVRRGAIQGIAERAGALSGAALGRACTLLVADDRETARAAATAVRRCGAAASDGAPCAGQIGQLIKRAEEGDASALGPLSPLDGPEVAEALLALARRSYETYRHDAVKWIAPDRWAELDEPTAKGDGRTSPDAGAAPGDRRQALERLLAKFPERSRERFSDPLLPPRLSAEQVGRMIRALSGRSPTADAWLAGVAQEAPEEVRVSALEALGGRSGPAPTGPRAAKQDEVVRRAVALALRSRRPALRRAALEACHRSGEVALPAAIELLGDDDFDVRSAAAGCLGRLGAARAVDPLLKALERERSLAAMQALARLGDRRATRPILELLQEDYAATRQDERVVVVRALGRLGDPAALPAIEREISHPEWRVRLTAARALARVWRPASAKALALCLNDYYAQVRRACRRASDAVAGRAPASRPSPTSNPTTRPE